MALFLCTEPAGASPARRSPWTATSSVPRLRSNVETWQQHKAKSSSPARSRARSTRRPCRRTCRSRPTRSPKPRSARRRRAPRSCTCTRATRRTAARRRTRSCSASSCRRSRRRATWCINLTTGGAPTMTIEERLQPALQLKPEVASLNMGSMNFGLYEMLGRYKEFKHDWEQPYLAGSRRPHLQEHLQGHRLHPRSPARQRHALRDRVLRHRPPLHRGALPRPRPGQAAAVHPVGVRHPRRHRRRTPRT